MAVGDLGFAEQFVEGLHLVIIDLVLYTTVAAEGLLSLPAAYLQGWLMASRESIRKRGNVSSVRGSSDKASELNELVIPDKLYFRIGEVARLCGVPAYVLRFWEQEFTQLRPNKGGTGQRLYRQRDVAAALRIKVLLYDEGYTIPGARQAFKAGLRTRSDGQMALGMDDSALTKADSKGLRAIRKEMRELHALLSWPADVRHAGTRGGVQPIRADAGPQAAVPVRRVAKPISIASPASGPGDLFVDPEPRENAEKS